MKITTKNIDGKLHVTATIPHIDKNKGKWRSVRTEELIEVLKNKNIPHGRVKVKNQLDNSNESTRSATWIFEAAAKPAPRAPRKTNTTPKTKKAPASSKE